MEHPVSWQQTIASIASKGAVCMVVGAADTGKTTFCAALASAAAAEGRRAAVVDADVGQSDVGPPACVGMGLLSGPVQRLAEVEAEALYFVGSTSPVGHLLPAVVGARLAVDAARRAHAALIVVDTTGLVHGAYARALKLHKIDALRPDDVVALQRASEAEHLLAGYARSRRPRVHRLPASAGAVPRTREQRAAARLAAFRRYFQSAADMEVALDRIAIQGSAWRTGKPLPGHMIRHVSDQLGCPVLWAERCDDEIFAIVEGGRSPVGSALSLGAFPGVAVRLAQAEHFEGLLVGVMDAGGETAGMGILSEIDFRAGRATLHSPVRQSDGIVALRLGSLRLALDCSELAHNKPGATG